MIFINSRSDFCQDYSYWSNKGECHGRSLKLTKMHESEYDKMDLNTQSTFDINEENRHSIVCIAQSFPHIFFFRTKKVLVVMIFIFHYILISSFLPSQYFARFLVK